MVWIPAICKERIDLPLPYQPMSGMLWNWSVILGMAVAMIELSAGELVIIRLKVTEGRE